MTKRYQVLVLGDELVDWHIIKAQESKTSCWYSPGGAIAALPGGARLLRQLIGQCLPCDIAIPADGGTDELSKEDNGLKDTELPQAMVICGLFAQEKESKNKVYRINTLCGFRKTRPSAFLWEDYHSDHKQNVVVIDDAGLGVRHHADKLLKMIASLPANEGGEKPWVVLKVAWPILDNSLLLTMAEHWGQRLIVIVPVGDLRRDNIQISRGLSWERTAQDIEWEFNYNPRMKIFNRVFSLVVPLGLSGVWLSNSQAPGVPPAGESSTLVYDPAGIEGDWEKYRPGILLGYTSCMTIGILQAIVGGAEASMVDAARAGLSAMRSLHSAGYSLDVQNGTVNLPVEQISQAVKNPDEFPFVAVPPGHRHYSVPAGVQVNFRKRDEWSILKSSTGSWSSLFGLAKNIVREGAVKSLRTIPYARFGNLLTVDKDEIEAFRTTHDLIQDYCQNVALHRPLSIAVFGPPGSGKSFGVAQVAKAVAGETVEKITFNVSQFTCYEELVDAFHRVRDIGLSGKVPLVFWDEFDSTLNNSKLYWLKAFLAPMQDGEFIQGQISHPIGRAIFVFAGGTASSVEELGSELSEEERRSAKVPDFKSRLRGCINMVGVDRVRKLHNTGERLPESDPQYVVRRAVILRSIIERIRPDTIDQDACASIDDGLLKALLSVWSFRHGVRSLESIVELCHLGDPDVLHRSSLPPRNVLSLHVDTDRFLGLITADVEFSGDTLETLAAAHHELYRENSPQSRLAAISYEDLSEEDKEKNRVSVRGIPYKLAAIGFTYELQDECNDTVSDTLTEAEAEQLSRLEHDRWILAAIDNGYVYGEQRDETGVPKKHPDLVPWDELKEKDLFACYPELIALKLGPGPLKNPVDMEMARQIPEIMQRAGYRVIRM